MKRIHYAGTSFVTGDDIAISLVRYAGALARSGSAAEVDVPVLAEGAAGRVQCLIGPSSQLVVEPAPAQATELLDEAVVADLTRRAESLEARWIGAGTMDFLDYDL